MRSDESLLDMLVKQLTEDLSPLERRALAGMNAAAKWRLSRDLEHAAAAVCLAYAVSRPARMPAALGRRIRGDAHVYFRCDESCL